MTDNMLLWPDRTKSTLAIACRKRAVTGIEAPSAPNGSVGELLRVLPLGAKTVSCSRERGDQEDPSKTAKYSYPFDNNHGQPHEASISFLYFCHVAACIPHECNF